MNRNTTTVHRHVFWVLFGFFALIVQVKGQSQQGGLAKLNDLFSPPTPQAFQFQKYGNLPVSYATGVPEIGVPLYELSLKDFKWPISLRYHASGIRVEELASEVGLGWQLLATGMISSRYGNFEQIDMEYETEFARHWNLENYAGPDGGIRPHDDRYLSPGDISMADGLIQYPRIPPIYQLSSPVLNHKFFTFYDKGYCMPASHTKIQVFKPNVPNGKVQKFIVTDEQGNTYHFLAGGESTRGSTCGSGSVNQSFRLDKIETYANETIQFIYEEERYSYKAANSYRSSETQRMENKRYECMPPEDYSFHTCQNTVDVVEYRLTGIEASTGVRIRFNSDTREDVQTAKRITSMEVFYGTYDLSNRLKYFQFDQGYFGSGDKPEDKRLKLAGVSVQDNNQAIAEKYTFRYNSRELPNRLSDAVDDRGYYNVLLERGTILDFKQRSKHSLKDTKACVLEVIQYPTRGETHFIYGVNAWGGLRIEQISDYDVNGKEYNYRRFEYPVIGPQVLSNRDDSYQECVGIEDGQPGYEILAQTVLTSLSSSVTQPGTILQPLVDFYPWVKEYFGDATKAGRKEYTYTDPNYFSQKEFDYLGDVSPLLIQTDTYSQSGILLQQNKTDYSFLPSSYGQFEQSTHPLEKRLWHKSIVKIREEYRTLDPYSTTIFVPKKFAEFNESVVSTPLYKSSETTTEYRNGESFQTIITYTYADPNNLNPTAIQTTTSQGEQKQVKNSYPTNTEVAEANLSTTDKAALRQLVTENKVGMPYFVETLQNNQCVSRLRTGYRVENAQVLLNQQKYWATCGTDFTTNEYIRYENKDLIEFKTPDGISQVVLRGYGRQYPVLKVVGASFSEVMSAFTSLSGTSMWDKYSALQTITNEATLQTKLAEVRQSFASNSAVQVFSYTYIPAVGISTMTDPNGRMTRYEYDSFNRLQHIRDHEGNITKRLTYQYMTFDGGTPVKKPRNQPAVWVNTVFTRCAKCDQDPDYYSQNMEQEQKDVNENSDTYGQTRWVVIPGKKCPYAVGWKYNGMVICRNKREEHQQYDANPCSETYGQLRWIDQGETFKCSGRIYAKLEQVLVSAGNDGDRYWATYKYYVYLYRDPHFQIPHIAEHPVKVPIQSILYQNDAVGIRNRFFATVPVGESRGFVGEYSNDDYVYFEDTDGDGEKEEIWMRDNWEITLEETSLYDL